MSNNKTKTQTEIRTFGKKLVHLQTNLYMHVSNTSQTPHRLRRGPIAFASIWPVKNVSNMFLTRGVVVAWNMISTNTNKWIPITLANHTDHWMLCLFLDGSPGNFSSTRFPAIQEQHWDESGVSPYGSCPTPSLILLLIVWWDPSNKVLLEADLHHHQLPSRNSPPFNSEEKSVN